MRGQRAIENKEKRCCRRSTRDLKNADIRQTVITAAGQMEACGSPSLNDRASANGFRCLRMGKP